METRYSILFQKEAKTPSFVPARGKKKIAKELSPDILAASLSRRPIILLGDVGVGKTIFIRHFIRRDAKDILKKALVLYIDFGKEPALVSELGPFVMGKCISQLNELHGIDIEDRDVVRGVYHGELERFRKGIYSELRQADPRGYAVKEVEFLEAKLRDKESHIRESLDHIVKARKRQVVIFLDNIDQRPPQFQEQVFLIAQSIAASWPGTVFISLRPDTFYQSRTRGSVSAYQPRVFTVAPPRVDLVIAKRVRFARSQLQEEGRLPSFPKGLSVDSQTLRDYLGVLVDSFDENEDLMEFIDNLSAGNIRRALEFVSSFVGSGHVDTEKILTVVREKRGPYIIPLHEFTRAVIYGDHEYYDPSASPLENIFDISEADGREHFLLGVILAHIERMGSLSQEQGFIETRGVYDLCQGLGFSPAQVHATLGRGQRGRLLEPSPRFSDTAGVGSYRITTVGAYTARRLLGNFVYLDAVVVDTPIVDEECRRRILDGRTILERLDRGEVFRTYLDKQWEPLAGKGLVFDWGLASESLRVEMEKIRVRVLAIRSSNLRG